MHRPQLRGRATNFPFPRAGGKRKHLPEAGAEEPTLRVGLLGRDPKTHCRHSGCNKGPQTMLGQGAGRGTRVIQKAAGHTRRYTRATGVEADVEAAALEETQVCSSRFKGKRKG